MTLRELSLRTYCLCMTLYDTQGAFIAHILFVHDFVWHSGSFHRARIVCVWLCITLRELSPRTYVCVWLCMTLRELSPRTYCLCMTLYHTPGALTGHICLCMTLYDTTRALTAHILFVYDFVWHSGSFHRAHIVCVWLCITLRELSPRTYVCVCLYMTLRELSPRTGGGPRVVVSTAAFHARVRGSVPGLGGLKETKIVSSPSTCES